MTKPTAKIREGETGDLAVLGSIDSVKTPERRKAIEEFVQAKKILCLEFDGAVVAFAAWGYDFFNQAFIHLVVVKDSERRKKLGLQLVRDIERRVNQGKIFTSTNQSNSTALNFFKALGFGDSGIVHGLDENDPEILLLKQL